MKRKASPEELERAQRDDLARCRPQGVTIGERPELALRDQGARIDAHNEDRGA